MKYMMTAAVLSACLFLCGCGDNEESTPVADTTTSAATVTTTVNTTTTEEQSSAKKTESTKSTTTTAAKTESKSGKRESSVPDNEAGTVDGATSVSGTVTAKSDTQPQQTSIATATENDNILTDDGLNWSPLVPVE